MNPGGWFQVLPTFTPATAVEHAMVQSPTNAQRETLHTVRKPIEPAIHADTWSSIWWVMRWAGAGERLLARLNMVVGADTVLRVVKRGGLPREIVDRPMDGV
jgi:hypothetical protein